MRKTTFYFTMVMVMIFAQLNYAQNSDKITRVLEYKPAPGQHINRMFPSAAMSDTYENALQFANNTLINNKSFLGLGAYGGYVVVGFDHAIVNVPGEYDFTVLGNAFPNSSEPGIVMVCQDLNGNGVPDPDEPWYELAGSEYNHPETIKNYEITYYRPDPDGQKSNIAWTDNQGGSGVVTHISFASQNTMYPLWETENTLTFKGSKLRNNATGGGNNWQLPAFDWGYADNHANTSSNDLIGFNIEWAVDDSGNSIHLDSINFIKVYTAVVQEAGWLGETSTEVAGVVDLHPQQALVNYPPVGEKYITLDLENTITLADNPLAPNSHWADTYTENVYLESQVFIFSHRSGWGGMYWDGFTISNRADNADYGEDSQGWVENQWGNMAKGGVNGEGSNYLVGYWGFYDDEWAADVTETSNFVMFNDGNTYQPVGVYVTNAPWPYYSMKNGDSFAKKFEQGDYFKLIAKGYAADGVTETGSTEFYLADYRSVNPTQWKLHDNWQWMDLSALGEVSYIQFTMASSDTGDWGMNTSAIFCMDKLTVEKSGVQSSSQINTDSNIQAYRSGDKIYQLPIGGDITIYHLNGAVYKQEKIHQTEMDLPNNELFIIRIKTEEGCKTIR